MAGGFAQGQVAANPATLGTTEAPAASPRKLPGYDVVTIRPNKQGPGGTSVSTNNNVFSATNVSLAGLLDDAYDLRPGMLSGEPGWADSARFDVRAKILEISAEELDKLTEEDMRRMLRDLLASRFGLQVHRETRVLPVYELVQSKGGAKLQQVTPEGRKAEFHGIGAGGTSVHGGMHGHLELTAHSIDLPSFAHSLSAQVRRSVVDKTAMAGLYDFHLEWTRDDAPAADEATSPPLFTALEEQLGLKLVAAKAPLQTLVVDRAVLPSEDEN